MGYKISIELADETHLQTYLEGLHLDFKRTTATLPNTLDMGCGTFIRIEVA